MVNTHMGLSHRIVPHLGQLAFDEGEDVMVANRNTDYDFKKEISKMYQLS